MQFDDLRGGVLHISRAASADTIATPKSGRDRALTIGAATAALWHRFEDEWRIAAQDQLGVWLFSPDTNHRTRITTGALGHRIARLAHRAGVKGASLHRLRHNVATFLVERGQILQAQARLGHADAATTLREYAYAVPLADAAVADAIDSRGHGRDAREWSRVDPVDAAGASGRTSGWGMAQRACRRGTLGSDDCSGRDVPGLRSLDAVWLAAPQSVPGHNHRIFVISVASLGGEQIELLVRERWFTLAEGQASIEQIRAHHAAGGPILTIPNRL